MNVRKLFAFACIAAAGMLGVAGCSANEAPNGSKSAGTAQMEMKLPPGWTQEDMQACMAAGTPGGQHERLTRGAGKWYGKSTMWMGPGGEPVRHDVTSTVTPVMGGPGSRPCCGRSTRPPARTPGRSRCSAPIRRAGRNTG